MATRIPVSWIVILVLFAVFAFFGYHIVDAVSKDGVESALKQYPIGMFEKGGINPLQPSMPPPPGPTLSIVEDDNNDDDRVGNSRAASVVQTAPPIPNRIPPVPAQTEEELRATKPTMMTPPAVQYDTPEATDPLNDEVFMGAEFGSNLRHPEQMIEMRPQSGVGSMVSSGLASERSHPGAHRPAQYSPEMINNGGEFMDGILAFDGAGSTGYSMI